VENLSSVCFLLTHSSGLSKINATEFLKRIGAYKTRCFYTKNVFNGFQKSKKHNAAARNIFVFSITCMFNQNYEMQEGNFEKKTAKPT
jgi:hypothetical protein